MERGGRHRARCGRVAAGGLIALFTLAVPRVTETKLSVPPPPPLLEAENLYPSPLRTALELESSYPLRRAVARAEPAAAPSRGAVALTFDTEIPRSGEARQTVNEILDVLRDERVHATFFVVGTWARANTEALRRIAAEGHEIANHSFDHRPFARRGEADLRLDLGRVAQLVESETGRPIAPLFRPPYGCTDTRAAKLVQREGYAMIGWTAAGADAQGATASPIEVVEMLERDLEPGAVVLLHTNRWITAAALPHLLREIRERELEPLPLSDMLARPDVSRAELERRATRPCGSLLAARRLSVASHDS